MGFLDIVLGLLLAYGLWKGLKNGLLIEIASLIALIAGIYGAIHFSYIAGDYISENITMSEQYAKITAFIVTFVLIVMVVHLLGKLLTKVANFALLGFLNKLAGALFGMLKVAVIVGAFLIFFDRMNSTVNFIDAETKKQSVLYEPIKDIGAFVFDKVLEERKGLSEEDMELEKA